MSKNPFDPDYKADTAEQLSKEVRMSRGRRHAPSESMQLVINTSVNNHRSKRAKGKKK